MRIIETYCDPTMFPPAGSDVQLAGNIMEANGIPLSRSRNDRTAAGFAIGEWMYTPLADGKPKLQIHKSEFPGMGCPMLIKTLPTMRMEPKNPGRLADGNDHWVIALTYFCMAPSSAPRIVTPVSGSTRVQQLIRQASMVGGMGRFRLGRESVRGRAR